MQNLFHFTHLGAQAPLTHLITMGAYRIYSDMVHSPVTQCTDI